jgi:hypothetical protein
MSAETIRFSALEIQQMLYSSQLAVLKVGDAYTCIDHSGPLYWRSFLISKDGNKMQEIKPNEPQLGCGTLILITLIVLIFSGGTKVEDQTSTFSISPLVGSYARADCRRGLSMRNETECRLRELNQSPAG